MTADPSGKPLGYVFKTVADQFVGQVSLFKVLSGTVAVDDRLVNTATGTEERLHALFHMRGREHLPTNKVVAGDLAAVAKLAATPTGSTLAPKDSPVRVAAATAPAPSFGLALKPITQSDDDKLSGALQRLIAEDPALVVERNDETGQTVLRGAGDTHLAVALERLARKFGVNVETEDVRVPYRETITGSAEAEGKIKKQSGGHGQFAVANLRVSPKARGEGAEFVNSIVGGAIPKQYIPAVQRGVEEAMASGGVHGFPVVDVRDRVLRRQVPLGRLVGHGVPHRRRPRAARGVAEGRRRRARAGLPAHRRRARRATRATCSATSTPAAAGSTARRCSTTGTTRSSPSCRRRRSSATPSSCAR